MGNRGISYDKAKDFVELVEKKLQEGYVPYGSGTNKRGALSVAIEEIGLAPGTAHHRMITCQKKYRPINWDLYVERDPISETSATEQAFDLPEFPDDDIEVTEILDHLEKRFDKKINRETAQHWFPVKIKSDEPIGLAVIGDPHLGSHCNIKLLRQHIGVLSNTPGMMAVNIGDTADNWGRLIHLYAEDDMSRPTERRLARWFLSEAGIPWILWLHGNHDTMHSEFSTYLKSENIAQVPMIDWRAKFKLVFPSGEVKIDAAHNHKGTSVYNPLHGQKRAALWNENADIFVAGHHHTWAIQHEELDDGNVVHLARARGYKWLDEYAVRNNFNRDEFGATILFVIDPTTDHPVRRITAFADLEEGAEFLTWKRRNIA